MRFQDKVALITAAASGIGRATADIIAKEGGIVVAVDNNEERLDRTVTELREAGGRAIGITCAEFRSRTANPYLTELHEEPDLFARTRRLIGSSRSFIILPGKSGTLAEAVFLWALRRAGLGEGKPVVLVGDIWPRVLEALRSSKLLEAESLSDTTIAIDEEEAVVKATAERAEAGHGESRTGSDAQG